MGRGLLTDKVALITGAGQGLGAAVAREFVDEGAKVALLEINAANLAGVESELRGKGGEVLAFPIDVTDYEAYAAAVDSVVKEWGRLDILVNNAAIIFYGTILEDTLENWRLQIRTNLEAYYMGSKLVAPQMVRQNDGRIISISSVEAYATAGTNGAYDAAKGGINALTKSMAVELAPYNIQVNAVAPGFLRTPMAYVNGVDVTDDEFFHTWYVGRRRIPMARTGFPEDMSGAVVFFASDYCRYMTGQVLVVDGGLLSTF